MAVTGLHDAPFVGRDRELDLLREALADVCTGHPHLVWVQSVPGMGKTSLVRAFLREEQQGTAVWVGAEETEVSSDWALMKRLVDAWPRSLDKNLVRLSEALTEDPNPTGVGLALVRLLRRTAAPHCPLVVVIDDAHLADEASAEAFRLAYGQLSRNAVLVVMTARSGQGHPVAIAWRKLVNAHPRVTEFTLGALSVSDVVALAASLGCSFTLGPARRLTEHTGGIPRYICSLLTDVDPAQLAHTSGSLPAPLAVIDEVGAMMARCSQATREFVRAAAVLGCPARLDDIGTLAAIDDAMAALDEAVGAGLLREGPPAPDGPAVSFVLDLASLAVYSGLAPLARRSIHARALGLCSGKERIHHRVEAARGTRASGQLAVDLERIARQELAAGAFEPAALYFAQAAGVSGATQDDRVRHLVAAAGAASRGGDAARAEEYLQSARHLTEGPLDDAVEGRVDLLRGRAVSASVHLAAAAADPMRDPEEGGASASQSLAAIGLYRADPDEVARWSRGDDVEGALVAAFGLAIAGRSAEARRALEAEDERCPNVSLALGAVRTWTDDLRGAIEELEALLGFAKQRGRCDVLHSHCLVLLADAEYRFGRWDAAIAHAESGVELASEAGRPWHACLSHAIAALPHIGRGNWKAARAHVDGALSLAQAAPVELVTACSARISADLSLSLGDYEGALHALRRAERACEPAEPALFSGGSLKALALLGVGRLQDASSAVDAFEELAVATQRSSCLAQAARLRGNLRSARGEHKEAVEQFSAGLAYLAGLGMVYEEARLRLALGHSLIRDARAGEGRAQIEAANAVLADLCAAPLLAECTKILEGRPSRLRKVSDGAHLTPGELRVLELVETGLSNRAIAERLSVTIKTVETHLSHIYGKLNVSGRSSLGIVDRLS